jgi:hypothetical protein
MIAAEYVLLSNMVALTLGVALGVFAVMVVGERSGPALSMPGRPLRREEEPTEHGPFTTPLPREPAGLLLFPPQARIPERPASFDLPQADDGR